jgi:hypothetical protein
MLFQIRELMFLLLSCSTCRSARRHASISQGSFFDTAMQAAGPLHSEHGSGEHTLSPWQHHCPNESSGKPEAANGGFGALDFR